MNAKIYQTKQERTQTKKTPYNITSMCKDIGHPRKYEGSFDNTGGMTSSHQGWPMI